MAYPAYKYERIQPVAARPSLVGDIQLSEHSNLTAGSRRCRIITALQYVAAVLVLTIGGFVFFTLSCRYIHHPELATTPPPLKFSCGNSTAEAIAKGCTWDALSSHWLHPECPHDFSAEFLAYQMSYKPAYWYLPSPLSHQILITYFTPGPTTRSLVHYR